MIVPQRLSDTIHFDAPELGLNPILVLPRSERQPSGAFSTEIAFPFSPNQVFSMPRVAGLRWLSRQISNT
jgi:hypothetical protein